MAAPAPPQHSQLTARAEASQLTEKGESRACISRTARG